MKEVVIEGYRGKTIFKINHDVIGVEGYIYVGDELLPPLDKNRKRYTLRGALIEENKDKKVGYEYEEFPYMIDHMTFFGWYLFPDLKKSRGPFIGMLQDFISGVYAKYGMAFVDADDNSFYDYYLKNIKRHYSNEKEIEEYFRRLNVLFTYFLTVGDITLAEKRIIDHKIERLKLDVSHLDWDAVAKEREKMIKAEYEWWKRLGF